MSGVSCDSLLNTALLLLTFVFSFNLLFPSLLLEASPSSTSSLSLLCVTTQLQACCMQNSLFSVRLMKSVSYSGPFHMQK